MVRFYSTNSSRIEPVGSNQLFSGAYRQRSYGYREDGGVGRRARLRIW